METTPPPNACCPNCGHEFHASTTPKATSQVRPSYPISNFQPNPKPNNSFKFVVIGVIVFIVVAIIVTSTNKSAKTDSDTAVSTTSSMDTTANDSTLINTASAKLDTTTKASAPEEKKETWDYSEDEDRMTSRTTYYASVTSDNQLDLHSPYDGYNEAKLTLRKRSGQNNIILQIDKGQFITGVYGTTVKVRFDDLPAMTFDCSTSADYDSRILFINSTSRFISKLKKAHTLLIEATLYQDGNQQMEFTVDHLKWNH